MRFSDRNHHLQNDVAAKLQQGNVLCFQMHQSVHRGAGGGAHM